MAKHTDSKTKKKCTPYPYYCELHKCCHFPAGAAEALNKIGR